jgi:hypothetical protein
MSEVQPTGPNLSIFDRIQDPLKAIDQLGDWFARSGMFRCSKVEQGKVLALACLVERRNPLELMREYHVMEDGTLAMRADNMQARFENDGGTVEWVRTDAEVCEIKLEHPKAKKPITVKVTMAELKDAGVAVKGDGTLKANYRRSGRQMLRARAISEGIRMIRPGIIVGIVTPEEASDEPSGSNGVPQQPVRIALTPEPAISTPKPQMLPPGSKPVEGAVVESAPAPAPAPSGSTDAWTKATEHLIKPAWAEGGPANAGAVPGAVTVVATGHKKSKAMEKAEKAEKDKAVSAEAERIATVVTNAVANSVTQAFAGPAASAASNPSPSPNPAGPLDADTETEVLAELFKGKEFEVNQWLVSSNWIAALGSWRGLRSDQRKKILAKPDAFMRAVIQQAEAKTSSSSSP